MEYKPRAPFVSITYGKAGERSGDKKECHPHTPFINHDESGSFYLSKPSRWIQNAEPIFQRCAQIVLQFLHPTLLKDADGDDFPAGPTRSCRKSLSAT
ncbi:hypothetical protein QNH14_00170 [Apirhabdus apintestini]|nr:hypothetical protein QNH14_00170 [Enterobacteriaceae bacterium CA-0114]